MPSTSPLDSLAAARVAVLPCDVPRPVLHRVLTHGASNAVAAADRVAAFVHAAVETPGVSSARPDGIESLSDLPVFAAVATLRVHDSDPLVGTRYETREPTGSAEHRMLQHPLRKHPGVTRFERAIEEYYVSSVLWVFRHELSPQLREEVAARLCAPPVEPPRDAAPLYATYDPAAIYDPDDPHVTVQRDGVYVAADAVSQCCRVHSAVQTRFPLLHGMGDSELPAVSVTRDGVRVPPQVVEAKLARYARHGWARLVHTALDVVPDRTRTALRDATPGLASNAVYPFFKRNNTVYDPYYAVGDISNPRRDWQHDSGESVTDKPLQVEDKRLVTVVDCIRASPVLAFDEWLPVSAVWDAVCRFFPAPHRPGNDVGTRATLRAALQDAVDDRVRTTPHPDTGELLCAVPEPLYTPLYAGAPDGGDPHLWTQYLQSLARQRCTAFPDTPSGSSVSPTLPDSLAGDARDAATRARRAAHRSAVTRPHAATTIDAVAPFVDPATIPELSPAAVQFLTTVGLAMERLLTDYSLTRSMRALRPSDTEIDDAALCDAGWIDQHDAARGLLYTVPAAKRDQLGIPNVSHDGYGELTTAEKALHRRGVDHVAAAFAARSDVTRVVRYCDLWRLDATRIDSCIHDHDLASKRIDVIAFDGETPVAAAGVETQSNAKRKPRRTVEKLRALPPSIDTWLVVPDRTHLWRVMRQLHDPAYLDFDAFPDSSADAYSRAAWESKLVTADILGTVFDALHTYRSLPNATISGPDDARHDTIVGIA